MRTDDGTENAFPIILNPRFFSFCMFGRGPIRRILIYHCLIISPLVSFKSPRLSSPCDCYLMFFPRSFYFLLRVFFAAVAFISLPFQELLFFRSPKLC